MQMTIFLFSLLMFFKLYGLFSRLRSAVAVQSRLMMRFQKKKCIEYAIQIFFSTNGMSYICVGKTLFQ